MRAVLDKRPASDDAVLAGVALLSGLAAVGLTALAVEGGARTLGAIAFATAVVWLLTTPRLGLALSIIAIYLCALDGYVKLSTGIGGLTAIRDVMIAAVTVGVIARAIAARTRVPIPPFTGWVVAYAALVLVQIFNPHAGTLLHSFAGVRQHLEYVPLFFLTFLVVRTPAALRTFLGLVLVLAAINGIVNFIQFRMSPAELAGWGPGYASRVLGTDVFEGSARIFTSSSGDAQVRPFGLLSEAGAGGTLCAIALAAGMSLISRRPTRPWLVAAIAAALGLCLVGVITSQGRGVLFTAALVPASYSLLAVTTGRGLTALASVLVLCAATYGIGSAFVTNASDDAFRYQGLTSAKLLDTYQDSRPNAWASFRANADDYPLGAGLAVAGPASGTSGGTPLTRALNAETQLSFSLVEIGVPGVLITLFLPLALFGLAALRIRHVDDDVRLLLAAVAAPILALVIVGAAGPYSVSSPAAPYLWASAGILVYWLSRSRPRPRA